MISKFNTFDICVLIPCYNNTTGLIKSLQSIHYHQKKLSILIVDDGSKVPVNQDLLEQEFGNAFTVIVIRNSENSGITKTLNNGLGWIEKNLKVQYIARLDCGDICHPERFYKQAEFLNNYPEIGMIGSWCCFQSPDAAISYTYKTPIQHQKILDEMHFRNVFIHPTVMFRSSILNKTGYYPTNYPHVEDYAFFMKIASKTPTAILDTVLVTCEINIQGISVKNRERQLEGRYQVVKDFGTNLIFKSLGLLKIQLLKIIPYNWILKYKNFTN